MVMMNSIEFQSRIGTDGILDLHVPLKKIGAGVEVIVTIRRADEINPAVTDPAQRRQLLNETYGSCADLALERGTQGEFESRKQDE